MRRRLGWLYLVVALLSVPRRGHSTVLVAWEYERELAPAFFLLTADSPNGHWTWRTEPSPSGACPHSASPDSYCTQLPQCPPVGAVTFTMTAVVGEEVSAPSEPVPCRVVSTAPCQITCPESQDTGVGGSLSVVPTLDAPAQVFALPDNKVVIEVPPMPTQDTANLPALMAIPAMPLFQPVPAAAAT